MKSHPVLRRKKFFQGRNVFGSFKDIVWLRPEGKEMTDESWRQSHIRTIGMVLNGLALDEYNERGERVADDTMLILLNANSKPVHFRIPDVGVQWELVLDSYDPNLKAGQKIVKSGESYQLKERTVVMMRRSNF